VKVSFLAQVVLKKYQLGKGLLNLQEIFFVALQFILEIILPEIVACHFCCYCISLEIYSTRAIPYITGKGRVNVAREHYYF